MYAEAPSNSRISLGNRLSPIVVLGKYTAPKADQDTPKWTGLVPGVAYEIPQPRHTMATVFHVLAVCPENIFSVRQSFNALTSYLTCVHGFSAYEA